MIFFPGISEYFFATFIALSSSFLILYGIDSCVVLSSRIEALKIFPSSSSFFTSSAVIASGTWSVLIAGNSAVSWIFSLSGISLYIFFAMSKTLFISLGISLSASSCEKNISPVLSFI